LRSREANGALSVYWALLRNELRELFASRTPWVMLLVLAPLVGYSFIQAVSLFSDASQSALGHPELARGMTPLDGIFVPTFGGLYLAVTLLFPFVAIRTIGEEKQSGALKLTLQLPTSVSALVILKFLAVGCVWLAALIPAGFAVVAWITMGGHVYWPELLTLLLGHAIYGQEAALRQMKEPLTITLYLSPDDSRAREMESNVLAKLKRAVPHMEIRYGTVAKAGMFGPSNDDRYGLVIYQYGGKREESRSNSPREVLPIVNELAGLSVKAGDSSPFPGYPLVTQADSLGIWFYVLLPALTLVAWWYAHGR